MKLHMLLAATAIVIAAPAAATNVVVNGGFETGDFSGWTQFGNTGFTGVATTFFGAPSEGSFQAYFGPVGSFGGISQTLTLGAGTHVVSFDLGQSSGNGNYVDFGGTQLLANVGDNGGAFVHYSFTVAAGANPTLTFGFQNDPSYYVLDNVSVSGVPEASTWAMLIAGFGLVGLAARRRSAAVAA